MNSVFLCFLVLLLSPSLVRANSQYQGFLNSYHGSDIVIDDTRYAFPVFQAEGLTAQTITDTQIFNVLAQILGVPQMLTGNPLPSVQKVNMFSRPVGSFFFAIEGYTPDYQDTPFKFLNSKSSVLIERTSLPYRPSSFLATSVTSQQPADHGIFSTHDSLKTMNIFDLVSKLYQGATVVGASLKESKARILSPKVNGHTISYDRKTNQWVGSLPVLTNFEQSEMKELGSELHFVESGHSIEALLKEVAFVYNAIKVLPINQAKYFLSFQFSSPKMIAHEFGASSATFTQAIRLIDNLLHLASQTHSSIQVLYLPAVMNPQVEEIKNAVFPHVEKYISGHRWFPEITLNEEGRQHKTELCAKLRDLFKAEEQVKVFCTVAADSRKRYMADPSSNGTGGEIQDVEFMHTYLWFFLLLIAALIYAMYNLAFIEPDLALQQSAAYVKKNQKWQ